MLREAGARIDAELATAGKVLDPSIVDLDSDMFAWIHQQKCIAVQYPQINSDTIQELYGILGESVIAYNKRTSAGLKYIVLEFALMIQEFLNQQN